MNARAKDLRARRLVPGTAIPTGFAGATPEAIAAGNKWIIDHHQEIVDGLFATDEICNAEATGNTLDATSHPHGGHPESVPVEAGDWEGGDDATPEAKLLAFEAVRERMSEVRTDSGWRGAAYARRSEKAKKRAAERARAEARQDATDGVGTLWKRPAADYGRVNKLLPEEVYKASIKAGAIDEAAYFKRLAQQKRDWDPRHRGFWLKQHETLAFASNTLDYKRYERELAKHKQMVIWTAGVAARPLPPVTDDTPRRAKALGLPPDCQPAPQRTGHYEPPRVSRRLQSLRNWSHEQVISKVLVRGSGARGADALRTPKGTSLAVGSDGHDRREDRLYGGDAAQLGAASRARPRRAAWADHGRA